MKVFIFGAGASVGSQGPRCGGPLALLINDLFDRRYEPYAHQAGLTDAHLEAFDLGIRSASGDLEGWLTDKWTQSRLLTPRSRQAQQLSFGRIAFYMWAMLSRVSLVPGADIYGRLIDNLTNAELDFGFINFNYDTLLDGAF